MSAAIAGAAASAAMPTGDLGNKVKAGVMIAGAILAVIVVIMVIKFGSNWFGGISDGFNKLLETLGIRDSAEEKKADADVAAVDPVANSVDSPFNPNFQKTRPAGCKMLTDATTTALAAQIYDSVGRLYDDPEAAFGAFKRCANWVMVSQIAAKFNAKYSKDVYSWMKIKYDTTSQKEVLVKIVNYCRSLPKYS